MDIRKKHTDIRKLLKEKEKIKLPERQKIINELNTLREAALYTERMMSSENYKPLSKNSIDKLSSFPQAKCFSDAFVYSIAEKLKQILEKNKDQFTTKFLINEISTHSVEILCETEDDYLKIISFDVWDNPPKLEANTYSTKKIEEYIEYFPEGIQGLENKKNVLIGQWQKELMNLKNMQLSQDNYREYVDESYICSDRFEQKPYTSNIRKQEEKLASINSQIKKLEQEIEQRTKEQEQAQYLENASKSINLADFEKLVEIVEKTLGINLKNGTFQKSPFVRSEKGVEKSETYDLYENNCKMQYVKKVRTFKK